MFSQIFFSPQVKQCAIIIYKHDIHEFPHVLPNDLLLKFSENWEILEMSLIFMELYPSTESFCQKENFVNTSIKLLKNKI